jgi:hydroxymethylbilane synthase
VLVTRERDLPEGATVGTASLRRQAQLRRARPGLRVEGARGNVDTRLRKLAEGRYDGLVLAAAGLARLGVRADHSVPLPVDDMVPAPGQGALAVQAREGDEAVEALASVNHPRSRTAFQAERELVRRLGGGCRLPLGAYAEAREDGVRLLGVVIRPDGSDLLWSQVEAAMPDDAAGEAAEVLLQAGAAAILDEVRE